MKRYASRLKTIAALLMLLALCSLLLPVCNIKTNKQTSTVSGIEVAKIGARIGLEYYKTGTIKNSHVITDDLTWGDVKEGISQDGQREGFKNVAVGLVIVCLPIVFCFLAMILTFMASGMVTMLLPTILLGLAVFENVILIGGFSRLQELIFNNTANSGLSFSLTFGVYVFMLLSAVALAIILGLWFVGGYNRPQKGDRDYGYDDKDDDKAENDKRRTSKKDKPSRREKRKEKRRKKQNKKDRKKRKADRKRKKKSNSNITDQSEQREVKQEENTARQQQPGVIGVVGKVTGLAGIYQGMNLDLFHHGTGTITLGTTQEAMQILLQGDVHDAAKIKNSICNIMYNKQTKQYEIMNHSLQDIIVQVGNDTSTNVHLVNGQSMVVGPNTLLYVGDYTNLIKLD